jgi:hypothetical protein
MSPSTKTTFTRWLTSRQSRQWSPNWRIRQASERNFFTRVSAATGSSKSLRHRAARPFALPRAILCVRVDNLASTVARSSSLGGRALRAIRHGSEPCFKTPPNFLP